MACSALATSECLNVGVSNTSAVQHGPLLPYAFQALDMGI